MSKRHTVELISMEGVPVHCRICGSELVPLSAFVKKAEVVASGIICADYARGIGRFFVCNASGVYISGNGKQFVYLNSLSGEKPFTVQDISGGIPRAAVLCGEYVVTHNGSMFKSSKYGSNLKCGVMHCGRLFGADGMAIRWSGAGGLEDWVEGINGAGYLNLDPQRGEVLNLLEYGEKLVAIRRFGLTVLSMFGNTENFSVDFTDTDCDEVFANTVGVVCGKLLFFTASGLKCFDGNGISRVEYPLDGDVYSPNCSAVFNGRYYLGCKSKFLNGGAVLCYDPAEGTSSLLQISADAICAAENLYAYNSSGVYTLDDGGSFTYSCKDINFGTGGLKTIVEMFVDGVADIEISNGRVARKFAAASGKIRPVLRGKQFTVTVRGSSTLKKLTATAEVLNAI